MIKLPIVPDFPKPGIQFIDIFPLFQTEEGRADIIAKFKALDDVKVVAAPEARGFILAGLMSVVNKASFIPFRKPGKLPTFNPAKVSYDTEYSTDTLEFRTEDIERCSAISKNVYIVDDVLATGGTAKAMAKALTDNGMNVKGFIFLAEVKELPGRELLEEIAPVLVLY